ncbi:MAG: DMT family transporter [Deltaproteobacteria bacterium]|nr:MAG: DMT family transporter [Deltaproteobacteria bacterium]
MQERHWKGYILSFMGVCVFALTLPMTKLALQSFSPLFITVGRVLISGLASAVILKLTEQPFPDRKLWPKIIITALGIAVGFPLFISLALKHTESSHSAIVLAILPLLTAVIGAWIHHERHKPLFWFIAGSGCATVLVYVIWRNGISIQPADLWTLGAAFSAAIGYSTGAWLSKPLGGLNTICWALAFLLPISIPLSAFVLFHDTQYTQASRHSVAAFIYLAIMSQFLGFVPWYTGLKMGGVARVSQVQLLQTFITLAVSSIFLSESISAVDWLVAGVIVIQIFAAKKAH